MVDLLAFVLNNTQRGHLCLAAKVRSRWEQSFHRSQASAVPWIRDHQEADLYFRVCTFDDTQATTEHTQPTRLLWADLDEAWPVEPRPTAAWETSPGRYQALWLLDRYLPALDAEARSRRLAYRVGADPSGWDCTQALRIPGTTNHKRAGAPVKMLWLEPERVYAVEDFPAYERPERALPKLEPPRAILERLRAPQRLWRLFSEEPEKDWSATLWALELGLLELGATAEEVYSVAVESATNKYRRDDRPDSELWSEVLKAEAATAAPEVRAESVATWEEPKVKLALPFWVEAWLEHIHPVVPRFRFEVEAVIFLSAFSALWSGLRIEGLPLAFWTLVIAPQGTGKSVSLADASAVVAGVRDMPVITSGSPEGLLQACQDSDGVLVVYDEYSGTLRQMARPDSYAATLKQDLMSLYDGRPIGHATRKSSIFKRDPHAALLAATTKDAWVEYADPEDITNGYLSRFFVTAADLLPADKEQHSGRATTRASLADSLRAHVDTLKSVHNISLSNLRVSIRNRSLQIETVAAHKWQDGDALVDAWADGLKGDEAPCDLDANMSKSMVPPQGRVIARVKKMAALLELLEYEPQRQGDAVIVRAENIRTACALAELGRAWHERATRWLSASPDARLADKLLEMLQEGHQTVREMQRRIHSVDARRIAYQLERVLLGAGAVHLHRRGQTAVWGLGPICKEGKQ